MAALAEKVLILGLIGLTLYFIVPPMMKKRKQLSLDRMALIIRKSHAGNVHYLSLGAQQQKSLISQTNQEWKAFHIQLNQIANYQTGIQKFGHGIPSNTSESWQAIQVYEINNYAEYQTCVDLLRKPAYATLTRMLDIQIVYAQPIDKKGQNLRIFS